MQFLINQLNKRYIWFILDYAIEEVIGQTSEQNLKEINYDFADLVRSFLISTCIFVVYDDNIMNIIKNSVTVGLS